MPLIESLAIEGGKALLGTVAGMGMADWNDQRQIEQQRKLQQMQEEGNRRLMGYGQELALDTWNKTSYEAQRKQMEKAGLNVGLMYQQGGAGGHATSGTSQGVTGGQAPAGGGELGMGMQLAMQMAMQKAQIENINADTQKKKAETTKTGTETDEIFVRMENIATDTTNKEFNTQLTQTITKLKDLEFSREMQTFSQYIQAMDAELKKLTAEAITAGEQAKIASEQLKAEVDLLKVNKRAQEAGIKLTTAETEKIKTYTNLIQQDIEIKRKENANFWNNWNMQERQTYVQEQLQQIAKQRAEFDTSTAQQIKQWTSIIPDLVGGLSGATLMTPKTQVKKIGSMGEAFK